LDEGTFEEWDMFVEHEVHSPIATALLKFLK